MHNGLLSSKHLLRAYLLSVPSVLGGGDPVEAPAIAHHIKLLSNEWIEEDWDHEPATASWGC